MRVDRWGDVLRALPVLRAALGSNVPRTRTRARAKMPLPPRTAQGSCMCAFRFTRLRMAGLLARCGIRCSRMPRCRLTPRLSLSGREVNLRSRFEIAMLCDDINSHEGRFYASPLKGLSKLQTTFYKYKSVVWVVCTQLIPPASVPRC